MNKGAKRKSVLVLNGPNLNLLGTREPKIYGKDTLEAINRRLAVTAKAAGVGLVSFQTNHEGELVEHIHGLRGTADAAIDAEVVKRAIQKQAPDRLSRCLAAHDVENRPGDVRRFGFACEKNIGGSDLFRLRGPPHRVLAAKGRYPPPRKPGVRGIERRPYGARRHRIDSYSPFNQGERQRLGKGIDGAFRCGIVRKPGRTECPGF